MFQQLETWSKTGEPGPVPTYEQRIDLMAGHFHGLVTRRGERFGCFQFRKILKWYFHFTRMPKPLYKRLINLSSPEMFDEVITLARAQGPDSEMPGHYDVHVPVPSGAIDKW
jgi:tRNA-dihydrouridine synthase